MVFTQLQLKGPALSGLVLSGIEGVEGLENPRKLGYGGDSL
jgi:hypothetical protein